MNQRIIGCLLLLFAMVGCDAQPSVQFSMDERLLHEDFSDPYAWESYINPEQKIDFQIRDGAYVAQVSDEAIMWALNETVHDNVVIDVETTQISEYRDNAYGLMCRASTTNDGNGYYFLISGDGQFTIRRGAGDEIKALIPWRSFSAIQQDKGINRMRVVCIGDYLALYVNDTFAAEAHDDLYRRGYAGFSAGVPKGGDVEVEFDGLTIWSASMRQS